MGKVLHVCHAHRDAPIPYVFREAVSILIIALHGAVTSHCLPTPLPNPSCLPIQFAIMAACESVRTTIFSSLGGIWRGRFIPLIPPPHTVARLGPPAVSHDSPATFASLPLLPPVSLTKCPSVCSWNTSSHAWVVVD